jgi:excisionase family DNA binding protein
MFEIELKFKVNGREVPCHAFIDALKLDLTEGLKNAVQPQKSGEPTPRVLGQQGAALERRAYSVGEAAELLRVSKATIGRRIREGKIRAIRVGSRVLVPSDSIQRLLRDAVLHAVVRSGSAAARARGKRLRRARTTVDAARIAPLRAQRLGWKKISRELGDGELISCRSQSPRDERREGDSPEVYRYMRESDSHCPFAVLYGFCVYHPAFLLLPGVSVLNQNRLPFLYRSGER